MDVGLLGLPNVGKSTVFNLLTGCGAAVGPYPFTTVEPNKATLPVPDSRLEELARVVGAAEVRPARLRVVDIAGLVEGASQGQGLGNRFLAHLREMDALFCVLRCFADDNVARAGRKECPAALDAVGELDILTTELALADAATVERRLEKAGRETKGKKAPPEELATLARFRAALDGGEPIRSLDLDAAARRLAAELFLLTAKPMVYVLSRGKPGVAAEEEPAAAFAARAAREKTAVVSCFAQLEGELAQLGGDDERCLREEYGLPPASSREDLLTAGAALLKLITFYTVEGTITSAWRVPAGTTAQEGAAKVHSDLGAHFIRAEVVGAAALIAAGGMREARAAGAARVEGPAYVLADGDVLTVKHNA